MKTSSRANKILRISIPRPALWLASVLLSLTFYCNCRPDELKLGELCESEIKTGDSLIRRGYFAEATIHLEKALAYAGKLGDGLSEGSARLRLGDIFYECGDYARAE
ncbi:MAG: hypothetical protein IJM29_06220, partial [Bacteroidales bacterium]|nr:hypothetical protein [Bacteroidales bacterium]